MQHAKPTLSVVVPHYNVAKYIDCLYRMLIPQISEETELLLIEDCSTDNATKATMRRWEREVAKDNVRFVYLDENRGLSGARNVGLSFARGEYVWFIDSDDTVASDAIARILNVIASQQPDVIALDFYKFYGNEGECPDTQNLTLERSAYRSMTPHAILHDKNAVLEALFYDAQMYAWSYIIKKSLWQRFPFPEGKAFEDIATVPKAVYEAASFYYLAEPLYFYRQRSNSILSAPTPNSCLDMGWAAREIEGYLQDKKLSDAALSAWYGFYFKVLRLSYDYLWRHRLLTPAVRKRYQEEEHLFYQALPWNRFYFIFNMKYYMIFKITSFLFVVYKPLYAYVKSVLRQPRWKR